MDARNSMNRNFHIVFFILCIAGLIACSKKSLVGHFTSNPENKAAFAGSELTLNSDGSFIMNSWTDSYTIKTDEEGNFICDEIKRLGHGTYTANKEKLFLSFTNVDYMEIIIGIEERSDADSSWYSITIDMTDEKGKTYNSPRLNVLDQKENIKRHIFCHGETPLTLHVKKEPDTYALNISMFGTRDFQYVFSKHGDGRHRFEFNRCRGYYAAGTELALDYRLSRKGIEYTNEQGRTLKLARAIKN